VWVDPEGDILEVTDIEIHYKLNGTPATAYIDTWNNEGIDDVDALHPFKHGLLPDGFLVQMVHDFLWRVWHPSTGAVEVSGGFEDAVDYAWALNGSSSTD
jgi:hypothetical protein